MSTVHSAGHRLRQLETVRERRHDDAARVMQQKRDAFMAGMRDAEAAQRAVSAALADRAAFLTRLREGAAQGGVSVAGLLDAQGWQAACDARIARANARLAEVLDEVARRRAAFDDSRQALRRAQARLSGTRELIGRERQAARAGAELRDEDAVEEAALRVWHRTHTA